MMNRTRKNVSGPGLFVSFVALVGIVAIGLAGGKKVDRPRLSVPRMESIPTIDGDMEVGEWSGAAVVTGFIGATGTYGRIMAPKDSRVYLGHDEDNFYIAVWTQLAPGEKPSRKRRRRDSKVFMDRQQFEIWLTPPTEGHKTAYQIIGNAYGALYDMKHVPALGIKNVGWNADVQFKNSYKTGEYWTAELAIPMDQLMDPDHYNPDKPWGGMVAVAWPQRSWPFTHGWYKNIDTHALMTLGKTETCVRLQDMSSLLDNRFEPEMAIVNGEDRDTTFSITATRKDMEVSETISVPAGETKKVDVSAELPEAKDKVNSVKLSVTEKDGQPLLEGDWMYRPLPTAKRKLKPVEPEPWKLTTRLSYARLNKGGKCWADLLEAPMRDKVEKVTFQVINEKGKPISVDTAHEEDVEVMVDREFDYDAAETYFWLPDDVPYGKYRVVTELVDENGTVLASATDSFTHDNYEEEYVWLNSDKYGEKLTPMPPYRPLKTDDEGFSVWGRRYEMDGALPAQMSSQDEYLLTRPINFVAVVDGEKQRAQVVRPFKIEQNTRNKANFSGRYRVAGMMLDLRGKILFDGCMTYSLDATPGEDSPEIDRLYLSVPVRKEVAEYMWSTRGGTSGMNYILEDLPQDGVIWSSDSIGDFVPYVGISDDHRAIQWFADDDHEWVLGEENPCAQVVKTDGEVEMQINFMRRSAEGEAFQADFGLIATPIKPMPDDWRNTILHFGNYTNSEMAFFYGPGHGKVGPFDWHDTESLAEVNDIEVPKGKSASKILDRMSGDEYPDLKAIEANLGDEAARKVRKGLKTYEDPTAVRQCYFHNAKMYFEGNKSMAFRKFFPGDWTEMPSSGWFHLRPVESYQDFFSFHLAQFAKFWHVPGLYFDETYYGPDYNVFNGQGKVMPDGSVRPSVGLTLERRFLYRMRQVLIDQGIDPFIWVHTSGMMAPYAIGATDIAMFGEPNIPTPQQDIMDNINESYMRVIGRAQKFGFVPLWMTMAGRGGAQWALPGRQTFGWCWLHDTVPEVHTSFRAKPTVQYRAQWGIGGDNVEFQGYWQDDGHVETADPKYRPSYWTRPDSDAKGKTKVLLMVMNMHYRQDDDTTVKVTIDPEKLNLPDDWKVYNLETMPDYVAREKVLDRLDRESNRGYGEVEKDPRRILGRNTIYWKGERKYELDELEVVSGGKKTFTIDVPERDFLTLIVE